MIFIILAALLIIFVILFTAVWMLFFNIDDKTCERITEICKKAIAIGDYKRANNLLKILTRKDKSIEIKYQFGISQFALEDYDKAKETFLSILKIDREHAKSLTKLAEIECAEKNYGKALEYYLASIKIDARNIENFTGIANVYWINKDYAKALEIYQKAKELAPEDSGIALSILKCKSELCNVDSTIDSDSLIEEYLQMENDSPEINREIAKIYAKNGDLEKAQQYCLQMLENSPADTESLQLMGLLMLLKQDLSSAKDFLTKAFSHDPKNIETHNILSYVVSQQVDDAPANLCRKEYLNLVSRYLQEN